MFDVLYLSIAISYVFLIGFVLMKGLKTAAEKYFLFFLVSLLLWHFTLYLYLFIPLGENLLLLGRINYAFGPLFTFGLLGFFYTFPTRTVWKSKKAEIILWMWTLGLALVSLLTDLIDKNETYVDGFPVVELGDWYLIYMVHMFAMPLLTLVLGLKKYWNLKGLEKTKFGFSFWIFVPTMLAFVITNGILPIYHIYWQFIYSPVFLIPIAISSAIAMYRFRFFDLPYTTLRWIRNVVILLLFSLIGVASFILLTTKIFPNHEAFDFLVAAVLALLIIRKVDTLIPEFTSSSFRTFREQAQTFQSALFTTNSYPELSKNLESTFVIKLLIDHAQVLLVREQETNIGIPLYLRDDFIEQLEQEHNPIVVAEEARLQDNQEVLAAMSKLNAEVCIPLYLDKQIIGLLILGKKSQSIPYNKEELDELLQVQQYVEIAFINILLQSDLKEENNLMKKMIKEKTSQLQNQNNKIKKVLRQQSDFIAVTAHEFRTPLNIALFQLADTLESHDHQSQVLEEMKTMESSLEKLKMLTQNLFDVQQFDLEKVTLEARETDINDFVMNTIEELNEVMKKKNITLHFGSTVELNTKLMMDPAKVRQVMYNLISNASHFTPEKGQIEVQIDEDNTSIIIAVVDHGEGVPDEVKEDIFDKFRTNSVAKGTGLGLGLYLCKKIMELHQGSIGIKDTPEGGATFVISFPKKKPKH